jgi:enoyl-CoA hydratase/carnithine racemase
MLFKRLSYLFSSGASNTKFVYEPVFQVATITLSNPSKRNTLSLETLTQINSHLDQVNTIKDARSLFIKS